MTELPDPTELLRAYATRAKKRFGQHFLTDSNILDRIAAAAGVSSGDAVLEIGPGCGTLTTRLLAAGARVTAVEIDRDAAAFLRATFAEHDVAVIEEDALQVDFAALLADTSRVAANLPYNVGTKIVFRLLEAETSVEVMAVMLQREVAERMTATPGTKAYGAMTLQLAELAEAEIAFRVKPGAFTPPPKVDSAVVVLRPHAEPRIPDAELSAEFRRVVTAGFAMRRKNIRNALGALIGKPAADVSLEAVGIDPRCRAETLEFDDFLRLATATREHGE